MTSTLLFAYAIFLAGPVALLFRRSMWFGRAPALGVFAWHVLSLSLLIAVALGAVAMIPAAADGHDHHQHTLAIEACVVAVAVLVVVLERLGHGVVSHLRHGLVERRRHLTALGLVGRKDARLDAMVVDHDAATAYCVPGRGRQIVLTTGAVRALDGEQLAAVLAHERAHLRGRHHIVVAVGDVLRLAFPFVPTFRWAQAELARLVELLADDAAAHRCERRALAGALIALAVQADPGPVPVGALNVAETTTAGRVKRLLAPEQPVARWAVTLWSAASLALLAIPVAAAGPASLLVDGALTHCPFV